MSTHKLIFQRVKYCICRFYPHHYAPYISDVTDFKDMNLEFDLSTPFLPFQQLMAVLPAASKELLPEPYQVVQVIQCDQVFGNAEKYLQEKFTEFQFKKKITAHDENIVRFSKIA